MSKKITSLNDFKSRKIDCPNCKSPSTDPHTPFCSQKCAYIDLGNWLNEAYVVPFNQDDEDFDPIKTLEQADTDPSLS